MAGPRASRTKNCFHVQRIVVDRASVLINLAEKNGHYFSSLAKDRAVQNVAQPVRHEFQISLTKASLHQGQGTSKEVRCASDAIKQAVHTFPKKAGDVYH